MNIERHIALTKASHEFMENWERDVAGVLNDETDGKTLNLTDEEREKIAQGIESAFVFVQEVLDDPTILEHLPDGSHLKVILRGQQDPAEHY